MKTKRRKYHSANHTKLIITTLRFMYPTRTSQVIKGLLKTGRSPGSVSSHCNSFSDTSPMVSHYSAPHYSCGTAPDFTGFPIKPLKFYNLWHQFSTIFNFNLIIYLKSFIILPYSLCACNYLLIIICNKHY